MASWLDKRRKQESALLKPMFDKYIDPIIHFITLECKPIMGGIPWEHVSRDFCSVGSLLTMLQACLKPTSEGDKPETLSEGHYERLFIYCVCWSLGAMLPADDRPKFNAKLCELAKGNVPDMEPGDTLFEYYVNEDNTEWAPWVDRVPTWEYPKLEERPKFASLVIPTLDSVRLEYALNLVSSVDGSSLFVGGPGTAKTTTIKSFISSFDPDKMLNKPITFSSLTTPRVCFKPPWRAR